MGLLANSTALGLHPVTKLVIEGIILQERKDLGRSVNGPLVVLVLEVAARHVEFGLDEQLQDGRVAPLLGREGRAIDEHSHDHEYANDSDDQERTRPLRWGRDRGRGGAGIVRSWRPPGGARTRPHNPAGGVRRGGHACGGRHRPGAGAGTSVAAERRGFLSSGRARRRRSRRNGGGVGGARLGSRPPRVGFVVLDHLGVFAISERADRIPQGARVLVAAIDALVHRDLDDRDDGVGKPRIPLTRRRRVAVNHLIESGVNRLRVERLAIGEQLVEHGARGEHVGSRVHAFAHDLLGRHVVRRAHDHAGLGQVGASEAGETEVEDLDLPVGLDVDVAGLEVAVDDIAAVRIGEAVRHLLHDVELLLEGQLALGDELLEVLALEELHGHVELVVGLAEVEHRDDVRVVQLGGGASLPEEPFLVLVVRAQGRGNRFDRDGSTKDRILGTPDDSHRPGAEVADPFILAKRFLWSVAQKIPRRFFEHSIGRRPEMLDSPRSDAKIGLVILVRSPIRASGRAGKPERTSV